MVLQHPQPQTTKSTEGSPSLSRSDGCDAATEAVGAAQIAVPEGRRRLADCRSADHVKAGVQGSAGGGEPGAVSAEESHRVFASEVDLIVHVFDAEAVQVER